jgi:chemotaxis protein CheX
MKTPQIIEAVQNATVEIFQTMLGVAIEPVAAFSDRSSPSVIDGVVSIVAIAGTWVGTGTVTCSAAFACRVCELFLMTEAPSVNDDVLDAVGELANMIIGNFKTAAEALVGPLGLSVPTVIYGKNFTSKSIGTNDWIIMPFKAGKDTFEVRVWFAPAADAPLQRSASTHVLAV